MFCIVVFFGGFDFFYLQVMMFFGLLQFYFVIVYCIIGIFYIDRFDVDMGQNDGYYQKGYDGVLKLCILYFFMWCQQCWQGFEFEELGQFC